MKHDDKNAEPPVAFIISVYKDEDPSLFDNALSSIEEQNYSGDVRIYLCADGPLPDYLNTIIKKHEKKIYKIFRNQKNMGLAKTLNLLLDNLEDEEFVFRMDSDDYSHPLRVATQVHTMKKYPYIDILGGAIREVEKNGNITNTIYYPRNDQVKKYIARRNPLAHPTVCFRKSAIEILGNYPEVKVNVDWALWFKSLSLGLYITNIDDVVVDMTVSENFLRRRRKRARGEFWVTFNGIKEIYGLNWRMVFPVFMYLFRYLPINTIKWVYASRLR